MKSRSFTSLMLLVAVLSSFLVGCSVASPSQAETVSVTDLLGREVSVPADVSRVVAIGPGALRLYVYAGNLDYVVGVEQIEADSPTGRPYLLANPELAELPVIGQGGPNNAPDPERILTVAPDVIFSTYATEASVADELQARTGIPVVTISYGQVGFGNTDLFGPSVERCTNVKDCVERLATSLRAGDVVLLKASRAVELDRLVEPLRDRLRTASVS